MPDFIRRLLRGGRCERLAIPRDGPLLTLDEVEEWVERVDARLPAHSTYLLPTYGRSEDLARPHIEVDHAYHFVVVERGEELRRDTTTNLHELLFWVFASITSSMSSDAAARQHDPANGFRRAMFRRWLQLLSSLDPDWSARQRAEIMAVLAEYPFTDGGPANFD